MWLINGMWSTVTGAVWSPSGLTLTLPSVTTPTTELSTSLGPTHLLTLHCIQTTTEHQTSSDPAPPSHTLIQSSILQVFSFLLVLAASLGPLPVSGFGIIGEALQAFQCGCGCRFYDVGTCETRTKKECKVGWRDWGAQLILLRLIIDNFIHPSRSKNVFLSPY